MKKKNKSIKFLKGERIFIFSDVLSNSTEEEKNED